jgi:hypothetical protein
VRSYTVSPAMTYCHCELSSTSVWMCCCKRAHAIVIPVLSFIYCLASNLKTDFIQVRANSGPKPDTNQANGFGIMSAIA